MIRIHAGRAWRLDPRLLSELRGETGGWALAGKGIVDALGIEIDGVDLSAGLTEDCVVQATLALAAAVANLSAGRARASVAFRSAGVELLLERRTDRVRLSLVRLQRPARVIHRGIEVEFSALRAAALDCGRTLLRDLRAINPALAQSAPVRELAAATQRLVKPGGSRSLRGLSPAPGESHRPAERPPHWRSIGAPGVGCDLEFEDDAGLLATFEGPGPDLQSLLVRGSLSLRLSAEAAAWRTEGHLFLILRELCAAAHALVRALEAGEADHVLPLCDGEQVALHIERGLALPPGGRHPIPCAGAHLARALFSAARDFSKLLLASHPKQRRNGYLKELGLGAEEGLARCAELQAPLAAPPPMRAPRRRGRALPQPPLVQGRLRRLTYRHGWSAPLGERSGLCLSGSLLLTLGDEGATALATDGGSVVARLRGANAALSIPDGGLLVGAGREASRLGPTGELCWSASLLGPDSPASALELSADGAVGLLASATEVAAFAPSNGEPLWRFAPPGCGGIGLLGADGLFVVATHDGRLYGIGADGKLRFRARTGARVGAGPFASGSKAILVGQRPEGARVHLVDLNDGRLTSCEPADLARAGGACASGDGIAVAGMVGGHGVVVGHAADGSVSWRWPTEGSGTVAPRLGPGLPQLTPLPAGAVAVRGSRAIACLGPGGEPLWEQPFSEEAPGGPAPLLRRGVLFVAGERGILAQDPRTGQRLGRAGDDRPRLAAHLAADDRLTIYCAEDEGPIEAFTLGTFLAIV